MIRRILFVFAAGIATALGAQPAPVLLDGPEIARIAWDTLGLSAADFDKDGKTDAALVNNEAAKIVLLYQRTPEAASTKNARRAVTRNRWEPVVENSRFEKVSIPSDQRHFALAVGDFDSDGRPDLALTGEEDSLLVRFQAADGTFTRTWKWDDFEPLPGTEHLRASDLNGDSRTDVAVLGKGKLLIFLQKTGGGFSEPISYVTGEDRAGQLFAEDADADGRTDLLYLAGGGEGTLRWRRQIAPGAFSSEVALPYSLPAYRTAISREKAGQLSLTRVNGKSQLIEQHAFLPAGPAETGESTLRPTLHSLPPGMKIAAYALGDFDGDGFRDVVVADGRAAQIAFYRQQRDGSFGEPQTFPSYAGISAMAAIQLTGEKQARLAIASRKEGFGFSRLGQQGRFEFPVSVPVKGEPVNIAALIDDKGAVSVALLVEHERKWRVDRLQFANGTWITVGSRELPNLKREPSGMLSGDLDGDRKSDILLTIAREPAVILLGSDEGISEPMVETANLRAQLFDLTPERVALIDLDGDGRSELVTTGVGFARSLRMNAAGKDLEIVDQFNARQPDNKLIAPAFIDTDGDSQPELLFAEAGSVFLQVLKKDESGVYRSSRRLEGVSGDVVHSSPASLGSMKAPHLLVISRDRFWTAPFGGSQPGIVLTNSYDTDLENCSYFMALSVDLNSDGKTEIVAFDREANLMEVLLPGQNGGDPWKSLLHFTLFEENLRFRGRKGDSAVREVIAEDFTGDTKPDLLLLVHDRVLLYTQG